MLNGASVLQSRSQYIAYNVGVARLECTTYFEFLKDCPQVHQSGKLWSIWYNHQVWAPDDFKIL